MSSDHVTIEDDDNTDLFDFSAISRSPSPTGGFAEQAVDDDAEFELPRSIHGEMTKTLQRRLNTYYGINRRVKLTKKRVQPLETRRAKPIYALFLQQQKRKARGLVNELFQRCLCAYHEPDMEPVYAVGWVMDMFPLETQYDMLRNYREDLLAQMGGDENMDDMFQVHFEKLSCDMFPDEMEATVREVVREATLKELGHA